MISNLRKEDAVVVWKLDRLARSLKHPLTLVSDFKTSGIEFLSLQDQINTTTTQGRLIFNMFTSLSKFEEKSINSERLHKNHVNVDIGSKLITGFETSSASIYDSEVLQNLLTEEDRGKPLYADLPTGAINMKPFRRNWELKARSMNELTAIRH
ncbi:hypothetical protein ADIARSV_2210 [Arcticibacter svalbardensis MN12-7]|uniref:Resolvase/invertase-type recombinase catalytic domain-containing protein n=1 Tax=Arcticibacter svalbardensis MN12-7 TaxID=1150600 RepID=R9GRZ0_9SPHI|nr:recombinase family protein [Arcticibacter svalbardensis]EOR94612.1 hypothetical protein ADIARSV_2210 [Arcticibacter svalbardensis MN12-7]